MIAALIGFWALTLWTFVPRAGRERLVARARRDWILDGLGLLMQGWVIPLGAAWLLAPLWVGIAPSLARSVEVPGWVSFAVGFVAVDYLYYWNHRLFHASRLWSLHRVHHTVSAMDVLATSRNSLWTSFFIVYLWATSVATYLLADPAPYLMAVTSTVILDLWRHSRVDPPRWIAGVIGRVLVLPRDHAWHHAGDGLHGNYGANLILWDQLHGTRHVSADRPAALGIPAGGTVTDELLRPWVLR